MNKAAMRRYFLSTSALVMMLAASSVVPQNGARKEVNIPDILGFQTLACDFHIHTVFSDGNVWPTTRVQEAWLEGLDAISITDHIEYHPHRTDGLTGPDRPYEIAKPAADAVLLCIVRGTEITKQLPPGHHNALFLTVNDIPDTMNLIDGVKRATGQGAFVFYNHPGWRQPNNIPVWNPEQEQLYQSGQLHGIEIVNGKDYYPLAHRWAIDKKLTLIGSSDVHDPITFDYDFGKGEHRPMTLVFAKNKTVEDIKKALFDRRTAVYWNNILMGDEKYLKTIFDGSVTVVNPEVILTGSTPTVVQVHNSSEITYELVKNGEAENIAIPETVTLYGERTVWFSIKSSTEGLKGRKKITLPYLVKNLYRAPEEGTPVELEIRAEFKQGEKR